MKVQNTFWSILALYDSVKSKKEILNVKKKKQNKTKKQ